MKPAQTTAASRLRNLLQTLIQRSLPRVRQTQETTRLLPTIYNPARSRGEGGISGRAGKPRNTPPLQTQSRDLECLDGAAGKSAFKVSSTRGTGMTRGSREGAAWSLADLHGGRSPTGTGPLVPRLYEPLPGLLSHPRRRGKPPPRGSISTP